MGEEAFVYAPPKKGEAQGLLPVVEDIYEANSVGEGNNREGRVEEGRANDVRMHPFRLSRIKTNNCNGRRNLHLKKKSEKLRLGRRPFR